MLVLLVDVDVFVLVLLVDLVVLVLVLLVDVDVLVLVLRVDVDVLVLVLIVDVDVLVLVVVVIGAAVLVGFISATRSAGDPSLSRNPGTSSQSLEHTPQEWSFGPEPVPHHPWPANPSPWQQAPP